MRTAHATALVLSFAVAAPAIARADRFTRAEAIFKQSCVSCHSLGWGSAPRYEPKKVDLTGVTLRTDGAALRRFLAEPAKDKPRTRCLHPALPRDAVADLVHFFEVRSRPPPAAQITPPRSTMRRPSDPRPAPPLRSARRGAQ